MKLKNLLLSVMIASMINGISTQLVNAENSKAIDIKIKNKSKPKKNSNENIIETSDNPGYYLNLFEEKYLIKKIKSDIPKAKYSMWWKNDNQSFAASNSIDSIKTSYINSNGYETYIFSAILRALKLADEKNVRIALPDSLAVFGFQSDKDNIVVLSASKEKGIRFHFDKDKTKIEFRDNFLKDYENYTKAWKTIIEKYKSNKDPEKSKGQEWFNQVLKITDEEIKDGKSINDIGLIPLDN